MLLAISHVQVSCQVGLRPAFVIQWVCQSLNILQICTHYTRHKLNILKELISAVDVSEMNDYSISSNSSRSLTFFCVPNWQFKLGWVSSSFLSLAIDDGFRISAMSSDPPNTFHHLLSSRLISSRFASLFFAFWGRLASSVLVLKAAILSFEESQPLMQIKFSELSSVFPGK